MTDLQAETTTPASPWILENAAHLWVTGDLDSRQRLQQAIFPDGLGYSMDSGCLNPRTAMAFNILETLKTPSSNLVPEEGVEPSRPHGAVDFESTASAIPPLRHRHMRS